MPERRLQRTREAYLALPPWRSLPRNLAERRARLVPTLPPMDADDAACPCGCRAVRLGACQCSCHDDGGDTPWGV